MFCPKCGSENTDGSVYCANCGYSFIWKESYGLIDEAPNLLQKSIADYLKENQYENLSESFLRLRVNYVFFLSDIGYFSAYNYENQWSVLSSGLLNDDITNGCNARLSKESTHRVIKALLNLEVGLFKRLEIENEDVRHLVFGIQNRVQKEVIVMTIVGPQKDIFAIRQNSDIMAEEMARFFKKKGIDVDVENLIFTLGGTSFENSQRVTTKTQRLSYDIALAEDVLADLVTVGERICLNTTYNSRTTENAINDAVRDLLFAMGYHEIKDQTRHGISKSGKEAGEVDILLARCGKEIAIIEAMKLENINGFIIDEHIQKAIINYNPLGTATFIIAYVNCSYFQSFWLRYYEHIEKYQFPTAISVKKEIEEVLQPNATTKIAKVLLAKDGYDFPVYFIALKIYSE